MRATLDCGECGHCRGRGRGERCLSNEQWPERGTPLTRCDAFFGMLTPRIDRLENSGDSHDGIAAVRIER